MCNDMSNLSTLYVPIIIMILTELSTEINYVGGVSLYNIIQ
jgi:hypothetical protein